MGELEELKKQRDALDKRIAELTDIDNRVAGCVKLGKEHYAGNKPDEYYIAVMTKGLEKDRWLSVIRDADKKSVFEISAAAKDLAKRATENKLTGDELAGGTMTVTNLGMYGIEFSTPIINLPEVAILGVGTIRPRLVLEDGKVALRLRERDGGEDPRKVHAVLGQAVLEADGGVQAVHHPAQGADDVLLLLLVDLRVIDVIEADRLGKERLRHPADPVGRDRLVRDGPLHGKALSHPPPLPFHLPHLRPCQRLRVISAFFFFPFSDLHPL